MDLEISDFLAQKQIMVPFSMAGALLGITPHGVRALVTRGKLEEIHVSHQGQSWRGVTATSLQGWQREQRPTSHEMVLIERAIKTHHGELVVFGDLLKLLELDYRNPGHRARLERILDQASRMSFEQDGYLLWAAVVMKGTGQPGNGFAQLARSLWKGAAGLSDQEIWAKQLKKLRKRLAKT